MNPKDVNMVCYHSPCQDGSGSAWIAHKYARENDLTYTFVGMSHNKDNQLYDIEGKNILFVDYAPTDELIEQMKNDKVAGFYILDHHITNQKRMEKYDNCIFDMKKSGAGLTWEYFYPGTEMPLFLQMIQDRDIWTFQLENTRNFCDGLFTHSALTQSREELFELFDKVYNEPAFEQEILNLGSIMSQKKMNSIKHIAESHKDQKYEYYGKRVFMFNCNHELASDLGNYMTKNYDYDFAVCWRYDHINEEYRYSLRSCGDMDVSQICKQYGGGGHKNAAGCSSKIHPVQLFHQPSFRENVVQLVKNNWRALRLMLR